jgi:hypothetical protein
LTASVGPVRIIDSKTFEITNESAWIYNRNHG